MALYKVQVAVAADSVLARDKTVNTFHLNQEGGIFTSTDGDGLASDVADLWGEWYTGTRETIVNIYDARGTAPNFPIGHAEKNVGQAPASTSPREVALCVSFRGERNLPHSRNRMFLGMATAGRGASGAHVPQATMIEAVQFASKIADLGGLDMDWQVYSPTTDAAENVQLVWCDDEWDTMRSRGLRSTTRITAGISE
jgi:hypothetical protein